MPRAETARSRNTSPRSTRAAARPDKVLQYVLSSPWAISEPGLHRVLAVASRLTISPEALEQRRGEPLGNARTTTVRQGVATIAINGPLVKRASWFDAVSGACDYETIARDLRAAVDDQSVRKIVLMIDSPGGEVAGCSELARQILDARDAKPIHAYVGGDCCSAAYWLASACKEIHVADTALVGNLGVLMTMVDDSRQMKMDGLERITIVSSQTPSKLHDPRTEPGRERVQSMVDQLADVFLGAVAAGRGIDVSAVNERFGAGGVFVGAAAVERGLADSVTTYEALLASLGGAETSAHTRAEADMPAQKKGRAAAARPTAKPTAKASAAPKAKTAAKPAAVEEEPTDDELEDDASAALEDGEEEPPAEPTDDAEPNDDEASASDDSAEDDEKPKAPSSKSKAAAAHADALVASATAERERIVSILGYAPRFGIDAVMPFVKDASFTRDKVAAKLLDLPANAAQGRLRRLQADDRNLSNTGLTNTAPLPTAGGDGATKASRMLRNYARVNPDAVPESVKTGSPSK